MEFFMSFRQYYYIQIQTKLSSGLQIRIIFLCSSCAVLRNQNLFQFPISIKYELASTLSYQLASLVAKVYFKITLTDVYFLHLLSLNHLALPEAYVNSGTLQCLIGADRSMLINIMDVSLCD